MEILTPEILKLIANGGIGIVLFVIWFITFTRAIKVYQDTTEKLFRLMEAEAKQKEQLNIVLSRLEVKLDILMRE
ncbi:MAG: hypothetical protein HUU54_03750 [Ignavibacteriaceae bacterium]|nr:hypothetical protein [Ignavibacteriaceae bacterium]